MKVNWATSPGNAPKQDTSSKSHINSSLFFLFFISSPPSPFYFLVWLLPHPVVGLSGNWCITRTKCPVRFFPANSRLCAIDRVRVRGQQLGRGVAQRLVVDFAFSFPFLFFFWRSDERKRTFGIPLYLSRQLLLLLLLLLLFSICRLFTAGQVKQNESEREDEEEEEEKKRQMASSVVHIFSVGYRSGNIGWLMIDDRRPSRSPR